jgi:hypothetical protein
MDLLMKCDIIALVILPFILGILHKRGAVTEKQMAFATATLLGLIVGSFYLSLRNAETLFSVPIADWSVAFVLSVFSWVYVYLLSRWIYKHWIQQ